MQNNNSSVMLNNKGMFDRKWVVFAWFFVFLFITMSIQLYFPYPVDHDTSYHLAVARLIKKYGILHSFPWTQFSDQLDHYADKEFFFHLLFVPLSGFDLVTASRIVGTISGTVLLTTFYLILRLERVSLAGVWTIVPLASIDFVYRFAQVRPHLLSIALSFIMIWAASRERMRILGFAAVLYPLMYVAFWQLPLILIAASEFARLFSGERLRWKPVVTAMAGITIGVALHPNSFNLLRINWTHMVDTLFYNAWGKARVFNLGSEFYPYSLLEWEKYLAIAVLMAISALFLAFRNRRTESLPLAFALAALAFGLLTIETRRFLEYFIPYSAAALAISTRMTGKKYIALVMLGISLCYLYAFGSNTLGNLRAKVSQHIVDPDFADYLRKCIPVGSQVFTTGWEYTGDLMLALPERRFLVAAEPTLMYKKDPKLYNLWYFIPHDVMRDPAQTIRTQFKSRFVISENIPAYWNFFDTLRKDPTVKQLHSGIWMLYDLGENR